MNLTVESIGDVIPYDSFRKMNLVVNNTAGIMSGDQFTIDKIYAFSIWNGPSDNLRTFTVLETTTENSMVITPSIIPGDHAFANVTQGINGGESITFTKH